MAFRVGQKVQCIKNGKWSSAESCYLSPCPKYGEICTINYVSSDLYGIWLGFEGYSDEEIWLSERFRPLVSTDISIFHSILANPHKELETV